MKKYSFEELELEQFRRKQDPVLLRVHWEQATPWQKSLILRDGCVRYLNQELDDYRQRRHVKGSLHGAALLVQSRIANTSPGSLCREMVPLSHDTPSVHRALGKLKKGMNYYYFVRLLEDIVGMWEPLAAGHGVASLSSASASRDTGCSSWSRRSEERRVGGGCGARRSPYH